MIEDKLGKNKDKGAWANRMLRLSKQKPFWEFVKEDREKGHKKFGELRDKWVFDILLKEEKHPDEKGKTC